MSKLITWLKDTRPVPNWYMLLCSVLAALTVGVLRLVLGL